MEMACPQKYNSFLSSTSSLLSCFMDVEILVLKSRHIGCIVDMARSVSAVTSIASSYVRRGEWNTLIEVGGRTQ